MGYQGGQGLAGEAFNSYFEGLDVRGVVMMIISRTCKAIFICSMDKLLKASPEKEYLDLIISFEGGNGEEVPGPPVRYYFK